MKWIAISGSWLKMNTQVENDVRENVAEIIMRGDGIVTGGAIGVDHLAIREAFSHDPAGNQIRVCISGTLGRYESHFRARAGTGLITREAADQNFTMLRSLQRANVTSLTESPEDTIINRAAYLKRNSRVIALADEFYAFWINQSPGTGDTVQKAKAAGKPTRIWKYTI